MHVATIMKALLVALMIMPVLMWPQQRKCSYTTLTKVNCFSLGLNTIPQNLRTNIKVLNAGDNKFGRLFDSWLTRYPELEQLYLPNCGVGVIEDSAFESNLELRILDLSSNVGVLAVPRHIFSLPKLSKLYLNDDSISNLDLNFTEVCAPIELLDVSNNKLTAMPRSEYLVDLAVMNVSGNAIKKLTVDDLAAFCSLKEIYVAGNPIEFDEQSCECEDLDRWLELRSITSDISLNCPSSLSNKSCSDFSNDTLSMYNDCMSILESRVLSRHNTLIVTILSLLFVILVIVSAIGYFVYYKKKHLKKPCVSF